MQLKCTDYSIIMSSLKGRALLLNTSSKVYHGISQNVHTKTTLNGTFYNSSSAFETEFSASYIATSQLQRFILSVGSAFISLINPMRADTIAILGETSGTGAMKYMLEKMKSSSEGQDILKNKPRINSQTVDLKALSELPEGTLGKSYIHFLNKNNVTPDSRLQVQFVDDVELAYIVQRYREVHDLFHTLLAMPTNMLGEVTVKWVEAIQTRLPMCIGGALLGAMRLAPKQRKNYVDHYLPWAIHTGETSSFLMNVYFEQRWDQSLYDLQRELNIEPLRILKKV